MMYVACTNLDFLRFYCVTRSMHELDFDVQVHVASSISYLML
jgi:hypothetical protein